MITWKFYHFPCDIWLNFAKFIDFLITMKVDVLKLRAENRINTWNMAKWLFFHSRQKSMLIFYQQISFEADPELGFGATKNALMPLIYVICDEITQHIKQLSTRLIYVESQFAFWFGRRHLKREKNIDFSYTQVLSHIVKNNSVEEAEKWAHFLVVSLPEVNL